MIEQKITSGKYSALITCIFILALTFSHLGGIPAYAAGILYATPGGTGDCSSWANACSLQTALTGASSGDEIWAAAGIHTPTDRYATLQLISGVALYGGFAGTETSLDQRDPKTHVTILSGDVDDNDSQTPIITNLTTVTGNTTNSNHVVRGATGATLDGFTITAGYAANGFGGGMYNISSPTLTNVTFSGNFANKGGGIANINHSNPILTNVTFGGNNAIDQGGGMFNDNSNPTLTNVTFVLNSAPASGGGGMYNESSSPTLTNVTFIFNSSGISGSGGGMANWNSSNPTLTNVTFNGNSANWGGGMINYSSSNPQIRNTIFWGNTDNSHGAQIYNYNSSTPIVNDSAVQDGCPAGSACTNIIINNPLLGTFGYYGGSTLVVPLLPGSSAIDTGNDATCATTDQRGITRPQGTGCDIGAYEAEWEQVLYTVFLTLLVK